MTIKIKRHCQGTYRVVNGTDIFGQIKKVNRTWEAEIRFTVSGDLRQFSGIWATKRDAVEEVSRIINREGF